MKNIAYKDYNINIDYDYHAISPLEYSDDIKMHCDTRNLSIGDSDYTPKRLTLRTVLNNAPVDRLFTGSYGLQSNIWLCQYDEINYSDIENYVNDLIDDEKDRDTILDKYTLYDYLSDKFLGRKFSEDIVMVAKKDTSNNEIKAFWDTMDDYIKGECYILSIEKHTECKCCNQEVVEQIDTINTIGNLESDIEYAKSIIDSY